MSTDNQRNKARAAEYLATCDAAPLDGIAAAVAQLLSQEVIWQGFTPLTESKGPEALVAQYLTPLRRAFPKLERITHILIGGRSDGTVKGGDDGRAWVGAMGYLDGEQASAVWGIPARPGIRRLRWSEFMEFDADGRIIRIQMLIDVLDWLEQMGLSPLPKPKGVPFVWPAPTGCNGVLLEEQDQAKSDDLLAYSRAFIFGGLNAFDKSDLKSMGMARFFHPNVKWYGPGGIGACLSLREFEDFHQKPWLVAFPDRKVGDLDNLFAEGDFVGASSLPGVHATHTGPYQGQAASGRKMGHNGIDFWRRDGDQFTENWVFVDMLHLFGQMGVDLLALVRELETE
jgi:predicted ester cyclase